ncbi:MAG: hypothetical protein BMS9Abin29_0038 [Gemmatimonadota bacterium]|nr:MAG: hypothetical protein BMS9Abin29_0038 [Gemmatimonadota bacterium]
MALLALLQPDARGLARVREALRSQHELLACSSWAELLAAVNDRPVQGCIIDAYSPSNFVSNDDLHELSGIRQGVAILIYSDFARRELELFRLGQQRVDAIIMADFEDGPWQIQQATARALSAAVATHIESRLADTLTRVELEALLWAAEHALSQPHVEDLARAMGLSQWRLARALPSSGLSTAREVLLWGRLFQAARLLPEPRATVEDVAYRLGYSSDSALRRALRSRVGLAPTEVIKKGGLTCVLDAFLKGR